ncbi:hypothetical protein PG997_014835 [Apiospora hydei]|uniref:MARVEL domain-containing protein n=1 Tax=Apiospora hydei TaxID=1337664 RepID=A0ABR1UUY5_9PEZI
MLTALRADLRKRILAIASTGFVFIILAIVTGCDAFSGEDYGPASFFACIGQLIWTTFVLGYLYPGVINDCTRYWYSVVAGSVSLLADTIVFMIVSFRVWSTVPFVFFLSFWISFAAEHYIGIISRPVEWYVNRTVPIQRQGAPAGGQAQPDGANPEVVPITEVMWEGRDEQEYELPPEYDHECDSRPETPQCT